MKLWSSSWTDGGRIPPHFAAGRFHDTAGVTYTYRARGVRDGLWFLTSGAVYLDGADFAFILTRKGRLLTREELLRGLRTLPTRMAKQGESGVMGPATDPDGA